MTSTSTSTAGTVDVTSTTSLRLSFHGSLIHVHLEPSADITPTLNFLDTHISCDPLPAAGHPADDQRQGGQRQPLATLRVAPVPGERHLPPAGATRHDIFVRKSASDFFTVPARRARVGGREYLECTRTGTRVVFDPEAGVIDVGLAPTGAMDLVELLRDLILKDQENAGAVVLHATAAYRDGSAVLVAGSKGAGKSTILLELVEKFGYQILSGDKTVLLEQGDGSVLAAGWPDYPHLGYGTIAKYPGLAGIAGLDEGYDPDPDHAFSPIGKFAVDPIRFRARFASAPRGLRTPVAGIVYPAIGPGASTRLVRLSEDADSRLADLAGNVESAFEGAHARWHHFLPDGRASRSARRDRILAVLARRPSWGLTGPGDLDADLLQPAAEPSTAEPRTAEPSTAEHSTGNPA